MKKTIILLLITIFTCLEIPASVTLTESQLQWKTFSHTVNSDYSLLNDTFSTAIVTHSYKSLVLENEYLKVTLVPEYGGRILSMIYKPTGHEQLYQNPVGRPYGPEWDAFYYDWLMVWGGIFPTFPEPEHGKAWCRPWAYEITRNTVDEVSVKMSFTDNINFTPPGTKFKYGVTTMTCNFEVTLAAQSSALKTSVTLVNPKNSDVSCEYWTNVGVSPGSVPGNAQCDDQTEIIGPVSKVKISDDWVDIQKVEQKVSANIYRFEKLRWYKNWANDGIAYAWPVEGNFWGAINHKNNEAIIRISENVKTPGLKLWGFGYNQSRGFNPETNVDYHRPFIEMWAGASGEFFTPARFSANSTTQFDEYYMPTVGMTGVSNAGRDVLAEVSLNKTQFDGANSGPAVVTCSFVTSTPAKKVHLLVEFRGSVSGSVVIDTLITPDPVKGNSIVKSVPLSQLCGGLTALSAGFSTEAGTKLLETSTPVSFVNLPACVATGVVPHAGTAGVRVAISGNEVQYFPNGRKCTPSDRGNASSGVRIICRDGKMVRRVLVGKTLR